MELRPYFHGYTFPAWAMVCRHCSHLLCSLPAEAVLAKSHQASESDLVVIQTQCHSMVLVIQL